MQPKKHRKFMKKTLPKEPLISVLMAVHNGMPYLPFAVKSVLGQQYKNIELLIVDDGSNDGTANYLNSIKNRAVKVFTNSTNLGLASSLNIALKHANGEYIARMDCDDISTPNRFELQAAFLKAHQDIDIIGSWATLIDSRGVKIGMKKMPLGDSQIKKSLDWFSPIIHPTLMAKKKVFETLGGYDKKYDFAEDYELLLRAKRIANFSNLPKSLLLWRMQENRRSYKNIGAVNYVDLKIKLLSLKMYGFSPSRFLAFAKQTITYFLLPSNVKLLFIKFFKMP